MIIDDFDFEGIAFFPSETDTEAVINPDAILSRAIPLQSLQAIGRRRRKISKLLRVVDLYQPAKRNRLNPLESFDPVPLKDRLGIFISERSDQTMIIPRYALYAQRRIDE
jgi:hypothetical protein